MQRIIAPELLAGLPDDFEEANGELLEALRAFVSSTESQSENGTYQLLEALAVYVAWRRHTGDGGADMPETTHDLKGMRARVAELIGIWGAANRQAITRRQIQHAMDEGTEFFGQHVGTLFYYEFTDDEVRNIQAQLDRLRELIANADELEPSHKARLLRRLEQLRAELQKRTSNLDRFYGLLGDAGMAVRKIVKDKKRAATIGYVVWEIGKLVWNAQSDAHKLPREEKPSVIYAPTMIELESQHQDDASQDGESGEA